MSTYITTHNSSGQAIFSTAVPEERHTMAIPGGCLELLSSTHTFPPNLSTESDIEQFAHDRTNGLPNGALCPPNGAAGAIFTFDPDGSSLFHRTMTLDSIIMLQGVLELHLDSGEVRTLKVGDAVTQRGTMHKWVNKTSDHGKAKIFGKSTTHLTLIGQDRGAHNPNETDCPSALAMPIVQPLEVAGKKLETEWVM
jgi:hypothetical protein